MQKFSENFKIIDKINEHERYIIDYANISQGLLKYQKNLINPKDLKLFFKNVHMGIPLLLPTNCNSFTGHKKKFALDKDIFIEKIFQKESEFSEKIFKFGLHFSGTAKLKEQKQKLFNKIVDLNNHTKQLVKTLKKKKKIVGAFQTRNIPHLGHQKIIELMLKKCDFLVINPVVGPKKKGDLDSQKLNKIFSFFSKNFYNDRIIYSPVCANMFYAGPREACHHANLREKLGFDYFIVGRDHAGANGIYSYDESPDVIKKNKDKFKINIISHYGSYYDSRNKKIKVSFKKDFPSTYKDISGTSFRKHLKSRKPYKFANKLLQEYIFDNKII